MKQVHGYRDPVEASGTISGTLVSTNWRVIGLGGPLELFMNLRSAPCWIAAVFMREESKYRLFKDTVLTT
jgi:hypothetical protein